MKQEFELIAKTFQGLEEVLAKELTELGANNIALGHRMVSFTGDKEMMYRANFCLRTAIRILKPIKRFEASDADGVYDAIKSIDWSQYLNLETTFSVDAVIFSPEFKHSKFVAYKVKDAIVDYFRETTGQRPNIRVSNPDIRLNIHIADKQCTLSLDSSGESLHLRGYRQGAAEAPINEVLAAGLLMLAGWEGQMDLIDPMCGSGTLVIEAALIARNIWPGVFRKGYAFEKWKDFDQELFEHIYNDDSAEKTFAHKIYGYDIAKPAIEVATANAKAAGVLNNMVLEQRPLQQFTQPTEPTLLITNPPYGERITTPDLLGLYRTLGEKLKRCFAGNEAWVISYHKECFGQIGLKPSLALPIYNGSLDCEFRKYQLFEGGLKPFLGEGNILKTEEDKRRNFEKKPIKAKDSFGKGAPRGRRDRDDFDIEGEIPEHLLRRHRIFESGRVRTHRDRNNEEGNNAAHRTTGGGNNYNKSFKKKPLDASVERGYGRDRNSTDWGARNKSGQGAYDKGYNAARNGGKKYGDGNKPYNRERKNYRNED